MDKKFDIKLIALDMDGTLLDPNEEISPGNREAIREAEEKGVSVVLSTGRNLATCREYAQSLELSSYLVTVNGSEIWDSSGELIERNLLDVSLMEWMWDLSQTHQAKFWAISCDRIWRNEAPSDFSSYEWLKFGFDISDDRIRELVWKELHSRGQLEVSNSSPTNIEVNALGINKAKAIEKVCDRLDITMDYVMAVGDSLNDIAMIQAARFGVAMGNAQNIVKETADWVTGSNTEDGVAEAIRKWVLS